MTNSSTSKETHQSRQAQENKGGNQSRQAQENKGGNQSRQAQENKGGNHSRQAQENKGGNHSRQAQETKGGNHSKGHSSTTPSASTASSSSTSSSSTSSSSTSSSTDIFYIIFSKSNILLLLWFLAIYFIIYFILGIFTSSQGQMNQKLIASHVFDFLIFLFIIGTIGYSFISLSATDKENAVTNYVSSLKDYIDAPTSILSVILFLFVFYTAIFVTGLPMTAETKPMTIIIVETIAWILLVTILIAKFFTYVLGISILDLLSNWLSGIWTNIPSSSDYSGVDISGNNTDNSGNQKEEVFNISNNLYTYDDARIVCNAYGARLATYDDIEKSYNDGGEWCNYGWSEDQMIYYPTQKATWNELQKYPDKKNNCGRPGINGGYIENPYVRFGVNCYGVKPKPTQKDLDFMDAQNHSIVPRTQEDIDLDKKVQFWKKNAHKININSFNGDKWSAS